LAASAQVLDEGAFSIRLDGREIGREEFSVRSGRGPDGKTAGTTITTVARYPSLQPHTTITAVLERSETGVFTIFQLAYDTQAASERYLGAQDRGRITIHRFAGDDRAAREFPGGASAYVMVDSAYALHYVLVQLATAEGASATAYIPSNNARRRIRATLQDGPTGRQVLLEGDVTATIELDEALRIQRLEFPDTHLSVIRLDD